MPFSYLIYYNNQDSYEGQDIPFAIVNSEKRAKTICAEIISFGNSLAAQMLYPFEDDISDDEYSARDNKYRELRSQPFPHGWVCESYSDFQRVGSHEEGEPEKMEFDANTVSYKKLPLLDKPSPKRKTPSQKFSAEELSEISYK